MSKETSYKLPFEELVPFLKGRTIIDEIESHETPDGLGWGFEVGSPENPTKVLLVSRWGPDDLLPSMPGATALVAKKPIVWVTESPQHVDDEQCPACDFLGTYHYFDQMICEYRITDLYICDDKNPDRVHLGSSPCPTFIVRVGPGAGNYYIGHDFGSAERDPLLKKAIDRATSSGKFVREEYFPQPARFQIGGIGIQQLIPADPMDPDGQLIANPAFIQAPQHYGLDAHGNMIANPAFANLDGPVMMNIAVPQYEGVLIEDEDEYDEDED